MSTADLKRRANTRKLIIQSVFLIAVVFLVWGAVSSAQTNLANLGITSGFAFLDRSTGWGYSFSLIERSIDDSYLRTLTIGFMNTLFLGVVSIVLATIIGFAVGTARDARNLAVNSAATIYVQVFRNVPLILQLVFWYAVLIHMPGPRQSYAFLDLVFLSNRGMMVPGLNTTPGLAVVMMIVALLAAAASWRLTKFTPGMKILTWSLGMVVFCGAATLAFLPEGESLFSLPELKGLRFVGGITVSIELIAMVIGIVLYGSAYIAEVVRGGLQEVPKGLIEAGQAVGLSRGAIWSRIKMPMALRTIVPPLGNQWIFLMKATTIGVAIGFSDLFMLVSTSITQSGQTLELIGLLMAAFLLINFTLAQFINFLNARLQLKAH